MAQEMLTMSNNLVFFWHMRCWQRRSTWSSSGTGDADNVEALGVLLAQEMLTTSKHLVYSGKGDADNVGELCLIFAQAILTMSKHLFLLFVWRVRGIRTFVVFHFVLLFPWCCFVCPYCDFCSVLSMYYIPWSFNDNLHNAFISDIRLWYNDINFCQSLAFVSSYSYNFLTRCISEHIDKLKYILTSKG